MTPLSVYIHWPFCKSKCPYCDFNSHVRDGVDHARWRAALLRELGHYRNILPGREVVSIFLGGGTPSLMEPDTVRALIDAVGEHWQVADTIEITLEANPTSVEAGKFREFRKAGINRVSLGVQSLLAKDLSFLGRQHNADEALKAVELARELFPRMSFDMIYALPGQTLAQWERELTHALTFTKGHISLYQLTIEENTAFHHAYHSGKFTLPEDGLAADMYVLTQSITEAHGMPAYEISNHAKPGEESRHNLTYWRGEDYIGIGPGAHGRYSLYNGGHAAPDSSSEKSPLRGRREELLQCTHDGESFQRIATETLKSPERWLERVETSATGATTQTLLSAREQVEETVMMGLRLRDGIDYADWQERRGLKLGDALFAPAIRKLRDQSLIVADDTYIKTTGQGRLLLNAITRELLATG